MASNLGSGQVTAGDGFMLTSFSAAFLGSAALKGVWLKLCDRLRR
jgi:ribose transport system permease protein